MEKTRKQNKSCRNRSIRRSYTPFVFLLTFLLFNLPWPSATQAAAGDLDPTFGNNGRVITDINGGGDVALAVVTQTDGKIVAIGATTGIEGDFALVRYHENGNIDTSYGTNGIVITDFFGGGDLARAGVIQADNKIIAVGSVFTGTDYSYALARYNTDGSLDMTFGSGGKVITTPGGGMNGAIAQAATIQPDGKIIVFGNTLFNGAGYLAVVRYNTNGTLDSTFGSQGVMLTNFPGRSGPPAAVALQPNGKIVFAGYTFLGTNSTTDYAVGRLNADGSTDISFGISGFFVADFTGVGDYLNAIAVQEDGKIVAVGRTDVVGHAYHFGIVRCNANGTLDTTFGTGGKVISSITAGEWARAVLIQPDGKILVTGEGGFAATVLARYTSQGNLDVSFGSGGSVTTPLLSGFGTAFSLKLQTDGRIIAAGAEFNDIALWRYQNDGAGIFDICLQDDSTGDIFKYNSVTGRYQFSQCRKKGLFLEGTGNLTRGSCTIGLNHFSGNLQINMKFNSCSQRGSGSVKLLPYGPFINITDSNTTNSVCSCP